MNLKDYRDICKECDKILLNPISTLTTIAIPYLHVIREHPVFTNQYQKKLKKNGIYFFIYLFYFIKLLVFLILGSLKKTFLRLNDIEKFGKTPERIDLVVVSHLIDENYLNNSDDFYFGLIQEKLQQSNKNVLIVFINHTHENEKKLNIKFNKKSTLPRIVLGKILSLEQEINNFKFCIKESMSLLNYGVNKTNKNEKKFIKTVSLEALSLSTFANLRIGEQIKKIVKIYKPKAILTTFEGHAYERIIYASARKINHNIKCLAYQHTRIFPYQHAMLRNLSLIYNPDVIFTSGKNSSLYIKKLNSHKNMKVEILGSPTFYRDNNSQHHENINFENLKQDFCIVMPEGIVCETLTLFDFIIDLSKNTNFNFIFRLHPLISKKKLYHLRPEFKGELHNNIIISNQGLDEDLRKSKWILYRGSTGVLKAIKEGIIPIYLNTSEDQLKIDPLFDLKNKKYQIKNYNELNQVFIKTNYTNVNIRRSNSKFYRTFLKNVYSEFKINTLLNKF